ncbi:MAG: methylated-DNA--[protein]-cysteine S-methyltransferase [Nitrospirales bacterium]|nr:methylated-DNA--[protein]-cysteine S-methyltransferase [Nitrospirales bacterium]
MFYWILKSPVGKILIAGDHRGLKFINFQDGANAQPPDPQWKEDSQFFRAVIQQLNSYFSGRLTQFRLPLAPEGTPFQMKVWKALKRIPYGKTVSYGEIAQRIGNPKGSRAVGAANGQNPLSIIVPCHRVIGQTGDLVGYGGGLSIKKALLDHERRRGNFF